MSNYSKTTDFEAKDSLPTGDSGKIIRGAEFETEFDAISTAIATKADTAGPTFTGTLTFETISDGTIGVTAFVDEDNMASNSATLVPTQQSVKAYVDSQVGANNELSEILANGNTTGGTNIVFGDSASVSDDRLVFGAGSDLQIYHSGVHSYIDDAGTGNLTLRGNASVRVEKYEGEILADFAADGAVSLYHDNSVKIATTSTGVNVTGNVAVSGTVDGRDVATDGTKLDGIEAGATADQTAAEIRTLVEAATDSNVFTDADHSKLDGIEALADVTDTANVTAAGALMDSELTSEASVKALNQGVATTDSPTFAAVTVNGNVEFDGLSGTGAVTVTDILDQDDMSGNSATALATQQSIKAYVDSQVATVDTLSEVLSNGNTTGGTDIAIGTGDDITFTDSSKAIFGAGSDLQIYHSGSASFISDQGTGNLKVLAQDFAVNNPADTANMITAAVGGAVTAFYNGNVKLATTNTGIDVTGVITTDGMTTSADINFGDNDKAVFGAGSDLQIYHDSVSNHSIIAESGSGSLFLRGQSITMQNADGSKAYFGGNGDVATVYYGTQAKLVTTSTGIDVTGSISADGAEVIGDVAINTTTPATYLHIVPTDGELNDVFEGFRVSRSASLKTAQYSTYSHAGGAATITSTVTTGAASGSFRVLSSADGSTTKSLLHISNGNDVSFYEDTGTTAKLFWDASAESLAIGKNALSYSDSNRSNLEIKGSSSALLALQAGNENSYIFKNGTTLNIHNQSSGPMTFDTSGAERMRIDASGNVGIGTSSPAVTNGKGLHLANSAGPATRLHITDNTTGETSSDGTELLVSGGDFYIDQKEAKSIITYTNGSERMRIDSSGQVGIGVTSVSNPLHVYHATNNNLARFQSGDATAHIQFRDNSTTYIPSLGAVGDDLTFAVGNGAPERMRIDSSGNVGIGTTSPASPLHVALPSSGTDVEGWRVSSGGGGLLYVRVDDASLANPTWEMNVASSEQLAFGVGPNEAMRIDASRNVGIGTSSPATPLDVTGGVNSSHATFSGQAGRGLVISTENTLNNDDGVSYNAQTSSGKHLFKTNGTERMRIDSSGNLLVGKTTSSIATAGTAIRGDNPGLINSVRNGVILELNRLSTDGSIIDFFKDGSTVGSIGVIHGNNLFIGGPNHSGLQFGTTIIYPTNGTSAAATDGAIDLGGSATRFKDLYLSGGVVFGATGGAVSSKTLDDYEEGTWTPNFVASTTTVTVNHASYVKIGKMVTVNFYIANISPATSGDVQYITGLPYAMGSGSHYPAGVIAYSDTADVSNLGVIGLGGNSSIYFHYLDGTSAAALTRNNWNSIKSSGLTLIISMTYEAA